MLYFGAAALRYLIHGRIVFLLELCAFIGLGSCRGQIECTTMSTLVLSIVYCITSMKTYIYYRKDPTTLLYCNTADYLSIPIVLHPKFTNSDSALAPTFALHISACFGHKTLDPNASASLYRSAISTITTSGTFSSTAVRSTRIKCSSMGLL